MSTNAAIGLLLCCSTLFVLVTQLGRRHYFRQLEERLRRERNRNRFGELRTEMMRLVAIGELDVRSPFFVSVYRGLTGLMRNPHDSEAAVWHVLSLPLPAGERKHPDWTPTRIEGMLAHEFSLRLDLLCRDYSRSYAVGALIMRVAAFVRRHLDGRADVQGDVPDQLMDPHLWYWAGVARKAQQRKARSVVDAREKLDRTARLAAA